MATAIRAQISPLRRRWLWKSLTPGKQLPIFLHLPARFSTRLSQNRCAFCASLLCEHLQCLPEPHQYFGTSIHSWARHWPYMGRCTSFCVCFFSLPPDLCGGEKTVKIQFQSFLAVPVCFQHLRGSLHDTHSTGEVYDSSFSFSHSVFQSRCLKMPI